ncbi:ABC transporter ATP-binding protein [Variovorax sp. YR216]|uniref:ABC transporter ATP-binding protein n=1 Tax=Variovorax sp. YR216 TaxID=1882828 RepID=UPI000898EAEA|nr:ABC transporter ATP-binding protein [Variovorax sp. YR216]SEB05619.1 branched-chain amino acid transport system ATP-binding protein [Variovorax sp. YR216]
MSACFLLQVRGLTKRFGGLRVTDGFDLDIGEGEVHAIIGPNGAGKTTLINQLSGELRPDGGSILFAGEEVVHTPVQRRVAMGMARSYQVTSVFPDFSALQNVMLAVQSASGHSYGFVRPVIADRSLVEPAQALLASVGLGGRGNVPVASLAHGARRQLELAMTLALRPRLMLLDEPMAGMSQKESAEMVELLQQVRGRHAMLLVEHDMDAVFALADRITVLVYGRAIATGTPDEIRDNPEVRHAYLGDEEEVL